RGTDLVRQRSGQLRLELADLLLRSRRKKLEMGDVAIGVDEALTRDRLQGVSEHGRLVQWCRRDDERLSPEFQAAGWQTRAGILLASTYRVNRARRYFARSPTAYANLCAFGWSPAD